MLAATSDGATPSLPDFIHRHTADDLLGMSNKQLRSIDPLVVNLLVAKSIPALSHINVLAYVQKMDKWEHDVRRGLASTKSQFLESPQYWRHDVNFFKLGYVGYYLDKIIGVRYREDQRESPKVRYVDPGDLFACGVMDSLQGTCANMALLHVVLGWRLRWPVSLACVWSHYIARYDDGRVTYNCEATNTGFGGFSSPPDEHYMQEHRLPPVAIECGSDLCALSPRQMLECFIGLRGRFFQDTRDFDRAESDFLLARSLFPNNRYLHYVQVMSSVQHGANLFDPNETGHPRELARWTMHLAMLEPWKKWPPRPTKARTDLKNSSPDRIVDGK